MRHGVGKRMGQGWSWLFAILKLLAAPRRHKNFRRQGGLLILKAIAILCCSWAAAAVAAPAEQPAQDDRQYVEKEVTGNVVYVGKRAISVESNPQTEMLLPVNANTKLERLGSLAELKPGDRVTVIYRQGYKKDDKGEVTVLETVATNIALMRRAPPKGALQSAQSTTNTGGR